MSSWIIFVSGGDVGNWRIAQEQALWDMTAHYKIHQGDVLYFFQTGAQEFLGQGIATSDATPLPEGTWVPWKDREPRNYKWRFTFDVLSTEPVAQPGSWGPLVSRLDKKGAPQAPRKYESKNDQAVLAGFFAPLDSANAEVTTTADEDRRRILEQEGREVRRTTFRAIKTRQGQAGFRKKLIQAYEGCCAVTGSRALSVLEAAHIYAYTGPHTNRVINGLLLRADIHTLFDLDRLTIVPQIIRQRTTYRCFVAPDLRTTEYGAYHAKPLLVVPARKSQRPDRILLIKHNDRCGWLSL